jgi:maltooligosyltrehalose synthase
MQVPGTTSSFTGNFTSSDSSNAAGSGTAPSFQSLLGQLTDYVKETPAQRMENSILAQLGITPQQLQSMTPQQRQKVEDEVRDLMTKELNAQQQQQQQQVQAQTQQLGSPTHSPSKHDTTIDLAI